MKAEAYLNYSGALRILVRGPQRDWGTLDRDDATLLRDELSAALLTKDRSSDEPAEPDDCEESDEP